MCIPIYICTTLLYNIVRPKLFVLHELKQHCTTVNRYYYTNSIPIITKKCLIVYDMFIFVIVFV